MECGEQCVQIAGITMMPELCADNWGTVSTQVKVRFILKESYLPVNPYVKRSIMWFCEARSIAALEVDCMFYALSAACCMQITSDS